MTRHAGSRWAARIGLAALLGVTFTAGLSVGIPSAAYADNTCHYGTPSAWGYGEMRYEDPNGRLDLTYPASLHGRTVRLLSDHANASAFADAHLEPGDVMTIDRSNFTVDGRDSHYWLYTNQVEERGTWDYCEVRLGGSVTADENPPDRTYQTPVIDGAHRAVRVCILHNGERQCTNLWYADNDDDSGDWFPFDF